MYIRYWTLNIIIIIINCFITLTLWFILYAYCTDLTSDPFNMDETDPLKSRAIESSLWEFRVRTFHSKITSSTQFFPWFILISYTFMYFYFQSLENHYYHRVSKLASQCNNPLNQVETKIEDLLENDLNCVRFYHTFEIIFN